MTICTDLGLWSLEQSNGRAALDSRGCLPAVAAQAGGGGETSCSSRNGSRPLSLPGQEAGRWSCHRRLELETADARRIRRRRATGSRRPDCPRRVGVANQSDTHSRVVPTGRGSKGVAPQRDWHSAQRPRIRKVGNGSTRNFIANTRAPPSLRRARCSRTSTFVIVPRRAA